MLRAHHATSIRYVISKLRWEQTNNHYLRNEDAWHNHNRTVQKLEAELHDVQAAQKGLDRFPNCFAPTAFPKPHGPPSKAEFERAIREEREKQMTLDANLEERLPWLKQLFVGPMTREQAKKNRVLREDILEGDPDLDLEFLLPTENMEMFEEIHGEKAAHAKAGRDPKAYEKDRQEAEKARIQAAPPRRIPVRPKFGPITKEEHFASLPKFGPPTKGEALLPGQRDQRHAIMTWMMKPWQMYDEQAAGLMDLMGKLAQRKLDVEAKEAKDRERVERARAEKEAKEAKEKAERAKEKAKEDKVKEGKERADKAERAKEDKAKKVKDEQAEEGKGAQGRGELEYIEH
jgi:hypothetical protein